MRVEILTLEGCPNADSTEDVVREAMRLEAVEGAIEFIQVDDPDLAQRLRFLGSPSVRVEGEDVEPSANARAAYGLMCRTYLDGTEIRGIPPVAMIRTSIRRHVVPDR
jgi:hypothetical protein